MKDLRMSFKVQVGPAQIAIHQGQTVLLTETDGRVNWPSKCGLYFRDTRVISAWAIYANGELWDLLNGGAVVVLDHLGIQKAHVCGLSMGGFATLHFGLRHPSRALSLCVAGCGYGAELNMREQFRAEADAVVASLRADGMAAFASRYAHGPTRVQLEAKNPRGFAVFKQALAEHSALGAANTQLGCQKERPSLYHLQDEMAGLTVPTLILTGDEDWPCLAPALLMKRTIPSAALSVRPNCGHTINLEAPDLFNGIVGDFVAQVDAGRWPRRDPRAMSGSITGIR